MKKSNVYFELGNFSYLASYVCSCGVVLSLFERKPLKAAGFAVGAFALQIISVEADYKSFQLEKEESKA